MSENFHESHWGQCLELLSHLCNYSDSVILVTGPEGIGKTTMKLALMEQEADQFVFCEMQGSTSLTSDQLTTRIENDFDVVNEKDLLLLIDDAQYLALDVISMIFQLKQRTAENGRLHIVLFATADLEQKVSRSVLKEEFAEQVHALEIEPLTIPEVEAFLRQQWRKKHRNNDMPFDRSKCKKIHALSGGIPGKVLEVVEEMSVGKTTKETQEQQGLSPFTVGLTVSFGILFCILAILWPAADKNIITKSESSITEPLPIAKQEVIAEQTEVAASADLPTEAKVSEIESTVEPQKVAEVVVVQKAPTSEPAPMINVASNVPESYDDKIASLEKKLNELQKQVATEQKALRITESKLQQLLSKQYPLTKQQSAILKKTSGVSNSPKKTLGFSKQEKHILALPSNNYTLQLISLTSESKVKDFLRQNNLQYKANYYRSHFKGRDWYIVVFGSYASRADAQLAASKLPAALKKLRPMPRECGSVQQAINSRGINE